MKQDHEARNLLLSLCFTNFVGQLPAILSGLLLIEIAESFDTSVPLMGQIRSMAALIGLVAAMLLGFLSVKYSYRSLLMLGLIFLVASSIGCSLSSSYSMMLFSYAFVGVSNSISGPMVNSLIGQHIPHSRRASAIGLITSSAALAYLVGSPSIAYLSSLLEWRTSFQLFISPLVMLCLFISFVSIPRSEKTERTSLVGILDGYKAILSNRSASACLLGGLFSTGIWSSYLAYSASFIRQVFLLPTIYMSLSTIVGATFFILGSLSSGKLVSRVGVRKLAVYSSIPSGLLLLLTFNTPNFWLALILGYVSAFSNGVLLSTVTVLNLEQVPMFRGTMMSLSAVVGGFGAAIGIGVVGWLILWGGYKASGLYMIASGGVAALIYFMFVSDPEVEVASNHTDA